MSSRRDPVLRLRRSWVRLGLLTAAAAGAGALVVAVLLERDEPGTPRVHVGAPIGSEQRTQVSPVSTQTHRGVVLEPRVRPAPRSVGEVLRQDLTLTSTELAAWIADEKLDPQVRYAALRRLEETAPGDAVTAALKLLQDVTPLLRLNAIAVLARSGEPRAKTALERLDERSRRLAEQLARR